LTAIAAGEGAAALAAAESVYLNGTTAVRAQDVALLVPDCATSSVCDALAHSLAARGLVSTGAATQLLAALRSRPTAPTAASVVAALERTGDVSAATPYVAGIVPIHTVAASGSTLRCAAIIASGPDGRRLERQLGPTAGGHANAALGVQNVSASPLQATAGGAYPLWALLTLSTPSSVDPSAAATMCAARRARTAFVCQACLVPASAVRSLLARAGATPLTPRECERALARTEALECAGDDAGVRRAVLTIPREESFPGTAWTAAFNHGMAATRSDRTLVRLTPTVVVPNTTTNASSALVTATQPCALVRSDVHDNAELKRASLGAVVFAVVANLPTAVRAGGLQIGACDVLALFNGSATTWDAVRAASPLAAIPPGTPVTPVVPASPGQCDAIAAQLARIAPLCGATSAALPGIVAAKAVGSAERWAVATRLSTVVGAVGIVPIDAADATEASYAAAGLVTASIVDPRSGWALRPTGGVAPHLEALAAQHANGASTSATSVSAIRAAAVASWSAVPPVGSYPFVGALDAVCLHNPADGCATYTSAVRFVRFVAQNARALTLASGVASEATVGAAFAVPTAWLEYAESNYRAALCAGAWVFPEDTSTPVATIVVAVTVPIGLLLVVVLSFGIMQWFKSATRDTGNAPKKPPFAIVFTDIQSSTALWALLPGIMGEAVDAHHSIIRRVIRRHRCYEVKTIGDSFMIVTESVPTAVKVAADIQKKLYEYDWGTSQIDRTYRELLGESLSAMPGAPTQTYRRLWNGLRVRIGIDFGDGQVRFDNVSKGFDYYGTCVNAAARIEALGHGGQILASAEVMEHLTESFLREEKICVDYLGTHLLRGLVDPVNLFMLAPKRFFGREYDELRLEQGGAHRTQSFVGGGEDPAGGFQGDMQHIPEQDRHYYLNQHQRGSMSSFDTESSQSAGRRGNIGLLGDPAISRRQLASRQKAYRRGSVSISDVDEGEQPVPYDVPAAFGGPRGFVAVDDNLPGQSEDLSASYSQLSQSDRRHGGHHRNSGPSSMHQAISDEYFEKLTTVFGPVRPTTRSHVLASLLKEWDVPFEDASQSSVSGKHGSSSSHGYVPNGSLGSDPTSASDGTPISIVSAGANRRQAFALEAEAAQQLRALCNHIAKVILDRTGSRRVSVGSATHLSDVE